MPPRHLLDQSRGRKPRLLLPPLLTTQERLQVSSIREGPFFLSLWHKQKQSGRGRRLLANGLPNSEKWVIEVRTLSCKSSGPRISQWLGEGRHALLLPGAGEMRRLWLRKDPKRRPGQSSCEGPGIRASVTAAGIPGIPRPHFSPHPPAPLRSEAGEPRGICGQVGLGVARPMCEAGPLSVEEK